MGNEEIDKLSVVERQSLLNQFKILEKLEEKNYELFKYILTNGLTREYHLIFEEIFNEIPIGTSEEVLEILRMYEALVSYARDNEEFDESMVVFSGFDSQNEIEHYKYLKYIFEIDKTYQRVYEFTEKLGYGSSTPQLHIYRKMLEAWRAEDSPYGSQMDEKMVTRILNNN